MTVHAKPCGFRTHLGNRCAIPTFPPPRRLLDSFNTNQERSFPPPSPRAYFRLILQLEKTDVFRAPVDHQVAISQEDTTGRRVTSRRNARVLGHESRAGFVLV